MGKIKRNDKKQEKTELMKQLPDDQLEDVEKTMADSQ